MHNAEHREIAAIRLIAKMPTLVAMAYKYGMGQPFMYPHNDLSLRWQLHAHDVWQPLAKSTRSIPWSSAPWTASSSCTLTTSKTPPPPPCACAARRAPTRSPAIAAGVACLWGPAHGGANEACLNMLEHIQANGGIAKVGEFMEQVKDKNSGVKLMGFGHRVYKNCTTRAPS